MAYKRKPLTCTSIDKQRAIEIQIYLLLHKLLLMFNNTPTGISIITRLGTSAKTDPEAIRELVTMCLNKSLSCSRKETHIVLHRTGVPVRTIQNITKQSNTVFYADIHSDQKNPMLCRLQIQDEYLIEQAVKYIQGTRNIIQLIDNLCWEVPA